MSAGIYQIRNIQNNKRYIGSTHNFEERFYRHRYQLQTGKHHSILLQRAWDKYGEENFVFEKIIEYDMINNDELLKIEQEFLDTEQPYAPEGYNVSRSATNAVCYGEANGMYGRKGENHPLYGRKMPKEFGEKISKSSKGKKKHYTPETLKVRSEKQSRAMMGSNNPNYGKNFSKSTREKIAAYHEKLIHCYDGATGDYIATYKSQHEAMRITGINNGAISQCCRKLTKLCDKKVWRFVDDGYTTDNIYKQENLPVGFYLLRKKRQSIINN